ncbi:MAG: DUF721 domain-containing protein [Deltaproteobacteria bacterium]|jgi:hypothetical protein|nr:DUF721 domain-containing protein [Deltaproteobacteria bacterium]
MRRTDYKKKLSPEDYRFPGTPPSIQRLLAGSLKKGRLGLILQNSRLFDCFTQVVGPKIREHAAPYAYQMGKLYLRVDSPHYLMLYKYQEKEWVKAINIEMGVEILETILMKVLPPEAPNPEVQEDVSPFNSNKWSED